MKNILVTGGTGFIGTNLIKSLLKNKEVSIRILDRAPKKSALKNFGPTEFKSNRFSYFQGDITNKKDVVRTFKKTNVVIHMAALSHTFDSLDGAIPTIKTNVMGTAQILEAAKNENIDRMIVLSSSEVYGNKISGKKMDENHPLNPVSPYAASKLAADRLANSYYNSFGLPVVILRLFNAYGPYQYPNKMIPLFITKLLKGKSIAINHGGKQKRDWVYVEDHVRAIKKILSAKSEAVIGKAFNIGTGEATSVKRVALIIMKELQLSPKKYMKLNTSSKTETMRNVGSSELLYRTLRWETKTSLEEGLRRTSRWYKINKSWWDT